MEQCKAEYVADGSRNKKLLRGYDDLTIIDLVCVLIDPLHLLLRTFEVSYSQTFRNVLSIFGCSCDSLSTPLYGLLS